MKVRETECGRSPTRRGQLKQESLESEFPEEKYLEQQLQSLEQTKQTSLKATVGHVFKVKSAGAVL